MAKIKKNKSLNGDSEDLISPLNSHHYDDSLMWSETDDDEGTTDHGNINDASWVTSNHEIKNDYVSVSPLHPLISDGNHAAL